MIIKVFLSIIFYTTILSASSKTIKLTQLVKSNGKIIKGLTLINDLASKGKMKLAERKFKQVNIWQRRFYREGQFIKSNGGCYFNLVAQDSLTAMCFGKSFYPIHFTIEKYNKINFLEINDVANKVVKKLQTQNICSKDECLKLIFFRGRLLINTSSDIIDSEFSYPISFDRDPIPVRILNISPHFVGIPKNFKYDSSKKGQSLYYLNIDDFLKESWKKESLKK